VTLDQLLRVLFHSHQKNLRIVREQALLVADLKLLSHLKQQEQFPLDRGNSVLDKVALRKRNQQGTLDLPLRAPELLDQTLQQTLDQLVLRLSRPLPVPQTTTALPNTKTSLPVCVIASRSRNNHRMTPVSLLMFITHQHPKRHQPSNLEG
jgi:hypothetical protein